MASTEQRLRRQLAEERTELAGAVETLREELGDATNVSANPPFLVRPEHTVHNNTASPLFLPGKIKEASERHP